MLKTNKKLISLNLKKMSISYKKKRKLKLKSSKFAKFINYVNYTATFAILILGSIIANLMLGPLGVLLLWLGFISLVYLMFRDGLRPHLIKIVEKLEK